ncbi:MAG: hypothetical protein KAI41_07145, partial [Hyphomicrobiaceae bacterium]|nr:hypothetical protein [Hyphomicrobiaceae bacterium]
FRVCSPASFDRAASVQLKLVLETAELTEEHLEKSRWIGRNESDSLIKYCSDSMERASHGADGLLRS